MPIAISQIPGVSEPLRRYLWEVSFVRTPVGVGFPDGLKLRAVSARVPGRTFERIEINYQWMTWAVTGREAADKEIELEFWEGTDLAVRKLFMEWLRRVGDWSIGTQGSRVEVTGDLQLKLLDGKGIPVRTIILRNVIPLAVEASELRYESNEVVTFTARFWYDWFEES